MVPFAVKLPQPTLEVIEIRLAAVHMGHHGFLDQVVEGSVSGLKICATPAESKGWNKPTNPLLLPPWTVWMKTLNQLKGKDMDPDDSFV